MEYNTDNIYILHSVQLILHHVVEHFLYSEITVHQIQQDNSSPDTEYITTKDLLRKIM